MSKTLPPATPEEQKINILNGIRYLFFHAVSDFSDTLALGRKYRRCEMAKEDFEAAMDRRFPPSRSAAP